MGCLVQLRRTTTLCKEVWCIITHHRWCKEDPDAALPLVRLDITTSILPNNNKHYKQHNNLW